MNSIKKISYEFERLGDVGIFTLNGELTSAHEDDLKLLLMRATHSMERAVLNLREVTGINSTCLQLLNTAYCTSIRLRKPLIMTEVPKNYLPDVINCESGENISYQTHTGHMQDYFERGI